MKLDWKLLIVIGLAAISAFLIYTQFTGEMPEFVSSSFEKIAKAVSARKMPKATGSIDDAANAVLEDMEAESAVLSEEDNDALLLGADSQAISEVGDSYNDSDF
ncbi:MAG: hypothetical protein COT34_01215 [Candidatus Nealsonbacteria bacterium CG08_land_8_20_14_0_20_43_11]|uniref:Uncharacterized protein n=1 Tax=Candidatus Nealsonbacteria bacterium CG08_land_8_20_14_0_20_43_11 TaxID=1974706 RepID=A0A2M6T148_9BACT|nr:MAG: hypothetical protein COT34_01215 [Candidatus Nealsonbacteria bacterium CG08_land_8_20_14_0_20_43_11]